MAESAKNVVRSAAKILAVPRLLTPGARSRPSPRVTEAARLTTGAA